MLRPFYNPKDSCYHADMTSQTSTSPKPGKGRLAKSAPALPKPVDLHRPDDLDPLAIEEWDRLLPILTKRGILTDGDYLVFASLCRIESRRKAAQIEMNQTGQVIEGPNGIPVVHPLMRVAQECERQLGPIYRELGLTPTSRKEAAKAPQSKGDEWGDDFDFDFESPVV